MPKRQPILKLARDLAISLILMLLAGCATTTLQGQSALSHGNYSEAASLFEDALARDPGRTDSLLGLGIARYKLGELDRAREALSSAVAQAPDLGAARFYLGLTALRTGRDGEAEEHLNAVAERGLAPRLGAAVDRTLRALRGDPVGEEWRAYMAAGLEDQAEWSRELSAARRALHDAERRRLYDDRIIYVTPRRCRCS